MKRPALLSLISCAAILGMSAEVKLPAYMTSNMVLQQKSNIEIPGTATPGAKVTATPSWGKAITAKADADGNFAIKLATPEAGGPFAISFTDSSDNSTLELTNILSGEVWLCSGQSNMEFPINGWTSVIEVDRVLAESRRPEIRLLQVQKNTSYSPLSPMQIKVNNGGWRESNANSIADFSAVAYLFACQLADSLKVPVGVIDTSWGGTPAEAWTGYDALTDIPGFESEISMLKESGGDNARIHEVYDKKLNEWLKIANADNVKFDKAKYQSDWADLSAPGYFDHSVLPYFDGIVWMQREVEIPAAWTGKEITVSLGEIDDDEITYFNGKEIGRTDGCSVNRVYKVSPADVKAGKAVITVRCTDGGGDGGFHSPADQMFVQGPDGNKLPLAGTWKYAVNTDYSKIAPRPAGINGPNFPSVLYNAMLYPLHKMPVKGYLWYQGCANVGRDYNYGQLMQALVNNWRKDWGAENPFYFVQLAGWLALNPNQPDSPWAALRNAQTAVLDLPNTGMASAIDLGDPGDIHPRNKQDVAKRLANIALNRDYGFTDIVYQAPAPVDSKVKGNELTLTFNEPVYPTNVAILGFILGNADGKFAQARGILSADKKSITLTAPGIEKPTVARYNWADFPDGNLYGPTGLPVAPFSTDK